LLLLVSLFIIDIWNEHYREINNIIGAIFIFCYKANIIIFNNIKYNVITILLHIKHFIDVPITVLRLEMRVVMDSKYL